MLDILTADYDTLWLAIEARLRFDAVKFTPLPLDDRCVHI